MRKGARSSPKDSDEVNAQPVVWFHFRKEMLGITLYLLVIAAVRPGFHVTGAGVELNPEYADMSRRRIERGIVEDVPKQPETTAGQRTLFEERP